MNILNDYISLLCCTNIENEDISFSFKCLLLSIPSSKLLQRIISTIVWTIFRPLLSNKRYWIHFYTQLILFVVL